MASSHRIAATGTDGIKRETLTCGTVVYTGPREALIARGLLFEAWIPEKTGRAKNASVMTELPDGRSVRVYRKASMLEVRHEPPAEIREANRQRLVALQAEQRAKDTQALLPLFAGRDSLISHLRTRYPDLTLSAATYMPLDGGEFQQVVTFLAPLDRLTAAGLVTGAMIKKRDRWDTVAPLGDGYSLCPASDGGDCWSLTLYTGTKPRGRENFTLKDAEKLLKRFALRPLRSRAPTAAKGGRQ